MFCKKCGAELADGAVFCANCGTKVAEEESSHAYDVNNGSGKAENKTVYSSQEADQKDDYGTGTKQASNSKPGLFNSVWNSEGFTNAAIRFSYFWDWAAIPIYLWLAKILFNEGGLLCVVLGLLSILAMAGSVYKIYRRIKKRKDYHRSNPICPVCSQESTNARFCSNCGSAMPQMSARDLSDPEDLSNESLMKMKKAILTRPLIAIAVVFVLYAGIFSGPVENVKRTTLGNYSHSIGTMVSSHMKSGTWEAEKLGPGSYDVSVKGYLPEVNETIRINLYYEENDDSYQTTLKSIELLDSGETYHDFLSMGIILGYLDE